MRAPVIDRPQRTAPQELRQLVGVDLVTLVALPQLSAPVADDDPVHERLEEIVHPLRLRPFLQRHMERAPHPTEELDNGRLLRRHDASGDHPPAFLPH